MTNALPSLSPVMHNIHVNVVSAEEASAGVAEFWSGDRLIGFTLIDDGDLTLRLTHPRYHVPRTYLAQVQGSVGHKVLGRLASGVDLEDGPAAAAGIQPGDVILEFDGKPVDGSDLALTLNGTSERRSSASVSGVSIAGGGGNDTLAIDSSILAAMIPVAFDGGADAPAPADAGWMADFANHLGKSRAEREPPGARIPPSSASALPRRRRDSPLGQGGPHRRAPRSTRASARRCGRRPESARAAAASPCASLARARNSGRRWSGQRPGASSGTARAAAAPR